ncbi:M14 family zinc carboxypeptidase [Humidisolicoccus flavus]|uniref:M14 family zinc carboxypeptidase n=1 Tax=Humidisolicoccus flavus TaxID=3111414 RepID=UPI00324C801C
MSNITTVRTITDDEIVERAAALPDFQEYPKVDELLAQMDELAAAFPELLTVRRIGTSRLDEPILMYSLSLTSSNASDTEETAAQRCLVVGGVHPNEPIGSHTIIRVLGDLLNDEALRLSLNTVWDFIPCIDPDGMRLNEGWFDDSFNDETYFEHFYRPPGDEQVEWTFPINYKAKYFDAMLPETQALQRVIVETKPDLYVPLHNSETGGAYFYISEPVGGLVDLLQRLPAEFGIPLHRGEPEAAHFKEIAPAVFESGTSQDVYEWREANGLDPVPQGAAGQSSTSYARQHGATSLIAELPIWRTFGADDTSPSGSNYADLLRDAGNALIDTGTSLTAVLAQIEADLTVNSPFLRSARVFVPGMTSMGETMLARAADAVNDRIASVAERPMSVVWMYRLRFGGALLRALKAEVVAGSATVRVRRVAQELEREWSAWMQQRLVEEETQGIPIRAVVGVQYGAVLGLVAHAMAERASSEQGEPSFGRAPSDDDAAAPVLDARSGR